MGIFLEVKLEIDIGIIPKSALWVSIPEALSAIETEPGESKILAYFNLLKGPINSSILEF